MKAKAKNSVAPVAPTAELSEDEIRDYAYHLYVQSGCVPGRDLENWLDAKSCLEANIPKSQSHKRSAQHRHRSASKSRSEPGGFSPFGAESSGEGDPVDTVVFEEFVIVQPMTER